MNAFVQFDLADTRLSFLRAERGSYCLMGQIAIFAGTPDAPHTQLLLANGYGEAIGGGFPGGAREKKALIEKAVKDAGYEGQLSGAEFLAILILVGFGTERPAPEFAESGEEASPETAIFNQACKLVAPDGYRTRYEMYVRGKERARVGERERMRASERESCQVDLAFCDAHQDWVREREGNENAGLG